jgi:LCP family protein required for cell wall assembly
MRKKTRTSRFKVVAGTAFYGLFLAVALGAGTLYGWAGRSPLLKSVLSNPLGFLNDNPKETFKQNSINLLILGCDEDRYFHGTYANGQNIYRKYARSDMMLLTKLDFDANTITGLSIPRDTMAKLPGHGQHKINAYHELAQVFHWGNANDITKDAVEHLLGVPIDRVIVLDFDAFEKMIDLVGGVNVDVPKRMDYDDNAGELHIHLKPGFQHLDGYHAMCFVRFRHDSESDFGRQQRQKQLLTSFRQSAFKSVFKLPEIAEQGKAVFNNAMTDDEILAMASFARKVPEDHIRMGMVPVTEGKGNYLVLDKRRLPSTLAQFDFQPTLEPKLSAKR